MKSHTTCIVVCLRHEARAGGRAGGAGGRLTGASGGGAGGPPSARILSVRVLEDAACLMSKKVVSGTAIAT